MKKFYIETYGCQMNVHESEKLAGILENKGYSLSEKIEDADVIVFNTCCIRESAETSAVAIVIPAEGPSLGTAPSGKCTWISRLL